MQGESGGAPPVKVIEVFKQRVSRRLRGRRRRRPGQQGLPFAGSETAYRRLWQRRYYDFNAHTRAKIQEKLHYMHENPMRAVKYPADWPWSSWCYYFRGEGLLRMDAWG